MRIFPERETTELDIGGQIWGVEAYKQVHTLPDGRRNAHNGLPVLSNSWRLTLQTKNMSHLSPHVTYVQYNWNIILRHTNK
jgi:hypothetical protein